MDEQDEEGHSWYIYMLSGKEVGTYLIDTAVVVLVSAFFISSISGSCKRI
jgi:hypothetical protein